MTCPACESTELRWAAVWARGTMVAECRRCGSVYNAPAYGTLVVDDETAYGRLEDEDDDTERSMGLRDGARDS